MSPEMHHIADRHAPSHDAKSSRSNGSIWSDNALARLDAALAPEDMAMPAYRLHRLRGNYRGFWAVTVRANWRVIFRFEEGHAVDVDYLDYH